MHGAVKPCRGCANHFAAYIGGITMKGILKTAMVLFFAVLLLIMTEKLNSKAGH